MNVLLVGGGGREHALAWSLARHGHALRCTHANPGFSALGATLTSPEARLRFEAGRPEREDVRGVDLVVIGPEGPLAAGLVDHLDTLGIPAFGPRREAARLETSKAHTKAFCQRHGLPTARAELVPPGAPLPDPGPAVIKLDGLAAGKGVWVCPSAAEARRALAEARAAHPRSVLLVEELLTGPEVSVLVLSDGERLAPLPPARDHKRRFDGDRGPNTGGMGAVAPVPLPEHGACLEVMQRAISACAAEGTPFRGVLYGGFMLTPDGPRLLEFNARFGDPECQALLVLLDEDPAPWLLGAARGRLPGERLRWKPQSACCVVVCGEAYPERGAAAPLLQLPADTPDLVVFHAGTRLTGGALRAAGGRVLGVTGLGPTPAQARARAYAGVAEVRFEGAAWRHDVGAAWAGEPRPPGA